MNLASLILVVALSRPVVGQTLSRTDTLRCRGIIATPAPSGDRDGSGPKTTEACRALRGAATAIATRYHQKADSISWRRFDVLDIDTKKSIAYYRFVFAIGQLRPNVFVDLPSFKTRIMENQ